jgi:hypothetical protein
MRKKCATFAQKLKHFSPVSIDNQSLIIFKRIFSEYAQKMGPELAEHTKIIPNPLHLLCQFP